MVLYGIISVLSSTLGARDPGTSPGSGSLVARGRPVSSCRSRPWPAGSRRRSTPRRAWRRPGAGFTPGKATAPTVAARAPGRALRVLATVGPRSRPRRRSPGTDRADARPVPPGPARPPRRSSPRLSRCRFGRRSRPRPRPSPRPAAAGAPCPPGRLGLAGPAPDAAADAAGSSCPDRPSPAAASCPGWASAASGRAWLRVERDKAAVGRLGLIAEAETGVRRPRRRLPSTDALP